jgi:diguanylate cyclase (GGDEF)-like protein/PAS domain S-box-containing protein
MTAQRSARLAGVLSAAASLFALILAGLALAGWWLGAPVLYSLSINLVAMNPMTALALVLAALALAALRRNDAGPARVAAGVAAALATAAIGALRLVDAAGGVSGVDLWLFPQETAGVVRMVPGTAFCCLAVGVGLALLDRPGRRNGRLRSRVSSIALIAALAVSFAVLVAYLYLGVRVVSGLHHEMALNTAACLAALAGGALISRSDRGLIALLTSSGEAGALARRLMLSTTAIPLLAGWVRYLGQKRGWYGEELGVALMAVTTVVILGLVVWAATSSLGRAVAARQRAIEALAAGERRYRELFDESPSYICTYDGGGVLASVNPAAAAALGYPRAELTGRKLSDFLSGESANRFQEHLAVLRGRGRQEVLIEVVTREGEERTWLCIQRWITEDGHPPFALGHALDVTERQRAEAKMAHQAFHDPLTGAANRALFDDRLALALAQARRHAQRLAVFYLDLDCFKPINDTFGHAAGDCLLKEITHRLQRAVRQEDTVARLGGDEFALLIADIAEADALRLGESLLAAIAAPVEYEGETLRVTGSIGISFYPDSGLEPADLLRAADRALYRSKAEGRGQLNLSSAAALPLSLTSN